MRWTLLMILAISTHTSAATIAADSARGERLFGTLSCVQCHSINGKGGKAAPDLGRRSDRGFTPAKLAATMWNHAPVMWSAMRERHIEAGDLNELAAADLFAYFYSARFFDEPGDAARGKRLFASKHCADCHGLMQAKLPRAKPVSQWESAGHPVALVSAMWNHAAGMRPEFAKLGLAWPELTARELTDIFVYVRNVPDMRSTDTRVEIISVADAAGLFASKGCSGCHVGKLALGPRIRKQTLIGVAAAMWNHAPRMTDSTAHLNVEEMQELVSYLWAQSFFEDAGSAAAGRRVFAAKRCATCHEDASTGAPKISGSGRFITAPSMVAALWHHGPRMLDEMRSKDIPWPRFSEAQMSDLIGFLNLGNSVKE